MVGIDAEVAGGVDDGFLLALDILEGNEVAEVFVAVTNVESGGFLLGSMAGVEAGHRPEPPKGFLKKFGRGSRTVGNDGKVEGRGESHLLVAGVDVSQQLAD